MKQIGKLCSHENYTVQNIAVGVSLKATLARPKSQILSLQSEFANIFFGFKSRWKTFAAIIITEPHSSKRETKIHINASQIYIYYTH